VLLEDLWNGRDVVELLLFRSGDHLLLPAYHLLRKEHVVQPAQLGDVVLQHVRERSVADVVQECGGRDGEPLFLWEVEDLTHPLR